MAEVFDEQLSLRRLSVALKREDWRMFEQGLDRLLEEIGARAPFSRHLEWQQLFKHAEDVALPEELRERLQEAAAGVLSLEVRIGEAAEGEESTREAIALVAVWQSSLRDAAVRAELATWLSRGRSRASALLTRWLEEGRTLEAIANRANGVLAANALDLPLDEPAWIDVFFAGLRQALSARPATISPRLAELIAERALRWIVAEPGTLPEASTAAIRLAGSLDAHYCHACAGTTPGQGALALPCARCGAPCWPLVVPLGNAQFLPPPVRNDWARAAECLRVSDTWVLLDPPAPEEDGLVPWLLTHLSAEKRVLIIAQEESTLKAWQAHLGAHEL
ncbi:MAG TPA: hypothetical protein V6D47_22515, partial [Oscillatoriaceae cyanobacterium]